MSVQMKVPPVGESITEVTIVSWTKLEGDFVEMDEILCELESDKATFEVTAEASGTLWLKAKEGDTLAIGDLLCEIEESKHIPTSSSDSKSDAAGTVPDTTRELHEMVVPTVGESITEVTLGGWLREDGDFVKLDENIAEIESDKATFDLSAEATGILRIIAQQGDTLSIGDIICRIEVTDDSHTVADQAANLLSTSATTTSGNETYATGHASPAATKILAEKNLSPSDIKGTGIDGRITKEDAMTAQKPTPVAYKSTTSSVKSVLAGETYRQDRREKMSALRKTVSRRLVSVKNETAMLTTFNEVNMKPIMDLRKKYKEEFKEKHGVGLGFMSFFTKACCVALKEWPAVNAKIDEEQIVYSDYCDVSIAVSAPKGLVVPVIRNAESLDFVGIEKEVIRLATKARENKLSIPEMEGGTFTITNGGVFGSMMSTPIINAPQSAILGMHNIVQRPMAVNGEVVILPMMFVALSYDHRIIDGRESVSFLVRVKELLEDPTRLLLGV